MGSINFNKFKNTNYSQQKYTYTDIFLDFTEEPFEISISNRPTRGGSRDIKVSYDLNAIKNSIKNLFNTMPGERILLPDYGCDLRQFIFEQISESNANRIGRIIKKSLEKWEPRVLVKGIGVDAYMDSQEYVITLSLEVPFLQTNEQFNISGLLNRQGYSAL